MAQTIAITIYKGGTGKTTSSVNLSAALAEKGQRVLLVDLDQQASATKYVGVDPDEVGMLTYNSFKHNAPLGLAKQQTAFGFDLIPSHELMSAIEAMMESGKDEGLLRERLASFQEEYDYILIDTPPGKGMLTFNAILAADRLLMAVAAESPAVEGMADMVKHLQTVLWRKFPELLEQQLEILFTRYKANTSHSPGLYRAAKKVYRDNVLPFYIPESVAFSRSFHERQPITHHSPGHPGAEAYHQLAAHMIHEAG